MSRLAANHWDKCMFFIQFFFFPSWHIDSFLIHIASSPTNKSLSPNMQIHATMNTSHTPTHPKNKLLGKYLAKRVIDVQLGRTGELIATLLTGADQYRFNPLIFLKEKLIKTIMFWLKKKGVDLFYNYKENIIILETLQMICSRDCLVAESLEVVVRL